MTTTTHLGITLVEQSQAQKEVTVNQAFTRIDALLNTGAKSRSISTPPGSPSSGDLYIVAASPTGAWSGQAGNLAYYDQIWRFITPNEGISLWVNDEDLIYAYNGSSWAVEAGNIGTVGITHGGTGQVTANAALNALLPSQTGNSGKILTTDGTNSSWGSAGSSGTVTSVATGAGLTGGPITTSGTIALASIANNDLLANTSGSSAAPVATTVSALVDSALGNTQGDILYRGASTWAVLAPGTSGQYLKTQGASANPVWASASPGGSGNQLQFNNSGAFAGVANSDASDNW